MAKQKIVPEKKTTTVKKTTAIAKAKPRAVTKPAVELSETGMLLKMAMKESDLDIEKFKILVELNNQEKERQCKKDFDFHFAEMQKEFTPIIRSQKGDKGHYAPVDELVKKYGPIIAKHGFTYSWNEVQNPDKTLEIILTISGYGHDKKNSKILPEYIPDKGTTSGKPIMNVLQAEGTRSTYGYRYTFKAGFGITETNEDTDGDILNFSDAVEYAEQIVWLKSCNTAEDLKNVWGRIYNELKEAGDKIGNGILIKIYNEQKAALSETE